MIDDRREALRQAIDWHLRLQQADEPTWHQFVLWLEADAAHPDVYDRIALDDSLLTHPLKADNDDRPVRAHRPFYRMAMAAGMLVALLGITGVSLFLLQPAATIRYAIETDRAAPRSVMLADGSRIDINRDSRVTLDRNNPRFAIVERGEATFHIRHDPRAPFRVESGSTTLQDTGTVFDVIREGDRLDVAVAEGGVLFQPEREAIALKPGMRLTVRKTGPAVIGTVSAESVGSWQRDRIEFRNAALIDVAQDAGRVAGTSIHVAPALAERRLSGTLRSDHGAPELVAALAALTGTRAQRIVGGWTLTADSDGAH
jgi:transmembrane sensor